MFHPSRSNGFTLVELLVVVSIVALLVGILLPALSSAKRQGRMMRELAASRTLMIAYVMYADDHAGEVLPGYYPGPAKDDLGNAVGFPINKRYPWRLAPYVDYQIRDSFLVHSQREEVESLKASGAAYAYTVSVVPSFGLNTQYVGGNELFGWLPYVRRIDEPARPSGLIVFASARSTPSGPGSHVEGYFEVRPPIVPSYNRRDDAFKFGFVDPRYSGAAAVGFFDAHAGMLPEDEFHDMRRWSDVAARANDSDWVWTN